MVKARSSFCIFFVARFIDSWESEGLKKNFVKTSSACRWRRDIPARTECIAATHHMERTQHVEQEDQEEHTHTQRTHNDKMETILKTS